MFRNKIKITVHKKRRVIKQKGLVRDVGKTTDNLRQYTIDDTEGKSHMTVDRGKRGMLLLSVLSGYSTWNKT